MSAEDDDAKVQVANERDVVAHLTVKKGPAAGGETRQPDTVESPVADEFGLPIRPPKRRRWSAEEAGEQPAIDGGEEKQQEGETFHDAEELPLAESTQSDGKGIESQAENATDSKSESKIESAAEQKSVEEQPADEIPNAEPPHQSADTETAVVASSSQVEAEEEEDEKGRPRAATLDDIADRPLPTKRDSYGSKRDSRGAAGHSHKKSLSVSEWSHQVMAPREEKVAEKEEEDEWQDMPAFATHRIYDDWGKVLAKGFEEEENDEQVGYSQLGGAGKGYTRVQIDDDAQSATSMDDNTAYLFKEPHASNALDEDEEGRDLVSQMQATKELLTEGQRIAYVGLVRLSIGTMLQDVRKVEYTKSTRKQIDYATEAMKMWGQKIMVRLYSHMEIDSAEQMMVEQLSEHGVIPADLTSALMQNARVRNPVKVESETSSLHSARPSISSPRPSTSADPKRSSQNLSRPSTPAKAKTPPPPSYAHSAAVEPPPEYQEHTADELTIQDREEIEDAKDLDLDIRWTVLCDLFLLLIADSSYDARSRTLLEHVGSALSVTWQEVCRFEKRVTDAMEMQEQADKENWNEDEHLEARRKAARNRRLMVMGLCTVGGGLVIGLSAGLLAPMIGAGLAAGFTTIGVTGTSTFLGGAGAAAMIGGGGALTGGIIGVRASNRRTGAVKTFEYRPLFNNKRPNLIITVSGWMTGKVDDVRLPFSTVDPIMGDMYSVNWEPEMLQSTGQTIQILATEALTQTIQQILSATILTTLMAGLNLPIVLTKLSYLIDNPWTVSLARADATGLILADSLIDRNLGVRPITLVGFSLGSRVIFSCLKELARKGALGLIQNVYLFGSPIIAKKDEYISARTVVSGRFVNGYATNDWILGYLFRATSGGIMRVSGLSSVDVAGIENRDVTEIVPGHMAYRGMMPMLLEEVGWLVDGLEFTEIEDPDPENHKQRQRELIDEIEAARLELDEKAKEKEKKSGFISFFSRTKKAPQKKEWETYDERSQKVREGDERDVEKFVEETQDIMFDVDAIRQEAIKLALQGGDVDEIKKHLQIRELESTMPALRIESPKASSEVVNRTPEASASASGSGLRESKTLDGNVTSQPNNEGPTINGHASSAGESDENGEEYKPPHDERASISFETPDRSEIHTPSHAQEESSRHERPPLKTVASESAPEIRSPDHNPWGEEEDFEHEKEVSMSFE